MRISTKLCVIGIFVAILLFVGLISFSYKEKFDTNNPANICLKYCEAYGDCKGCQSCMDLCDTWGFYLSSGGHFPCPPFMPREVCEKYSNF
jgi:hypothetical protein